MGFTLFFSYEVKIELFKRGDAERRKINIEEDGMYINSRKIQNLNNV